MGRTSETTTQPQEEAPDQPDAPPPTPDAPEAPPTPTPPDPARPSAAVTTPATTPAPAIPEEVTPDKTALLTFLAAPDWTARRALVLHPDHVAPQMEALATTIGDGPITPTRITRMHRTGNSAVYQIFADSHPKGLPIALSFVDERWLVDWTGYAEFYYKRFHAFVTGSEESSGAFRVLIKPELAGLGDTGRQPYAATTPDMDAPIIIYAGDDTKEYQTLEDMIGGLAARAPGSFRQLMEAGGVPLILHLSKTVEDDQTILMIDRIVGQGWSPQAPESP